MDAHANDRVGRQGGTFHGSLGGGHTGRKAPSGDGISLRAGRDQREPQIRSGAAGGRLHACRTAEDLSLSEREVDSGGRTGPSTAAATGGAGPPVQHANIRGAEYYADGAKTAQEV